MGFILLAVAGYLAYLAKKMETDVERMEYNDMHLGGSFDERKAREQKIAWKRFWIKCVSWIAVALLFAGMFGVLYFFLAKH